MFISKNSNKNHRAGKKLSIILLIYIFQLINLKFNKHRIFKMKSNRTSIYLEKKGIPYKTLLNLEKKELLKFISETTSKNITKEKKIFLNNRCRFGNQLTLLSKVITICRILKFKKIIIEKNNNRYWFIKGKILDKKNKIVILKDKFSPLKYNDIIYDRTKNFYYYNRYISLTQGFDMIKGEILKNLPKVICNKYELYIYIRSGDIFKHAHRSYSQPPLCYYENILNNYYFKKFYLVTENKNNPVINILLQKYPNIVYKKSSINYDVAKLVNAFNLAGGQISTFFEQILKLNINLKILFFFKMEVRQSNLGKENSINNIFYKSRMKTFIMYSTKEYIKKMRPWRNTEIQRNMMINSSCNNFFHLM